MIALYFLSSVSAGMACQSLFIAPMSNPWTLSGSRVPISQPEYDWEKVGGLVNEGPGRAPARRPDLHHLFRQFLRHARLQTGDADLQRRRSAEHRARGSRIPNPSFSARTQMASTRPVTTASSNRRTAQKTGLSTTPTTRHAGLRRRPHHPRPEVHLERRWHAQFRHPRLDQ